MIRTTRLAASAVTVLVLALVLAACGGSSSDGGSTTSTASDVYKPQAATAVAAVRATGDAVGATMGSIKDKGDAEIAKELAAVKTQGVKALALLKALKPSSDQDKKLVVAVVDPLTVGVADIGALADAADLSDSTKFNAAADKLVADSPAIKTANNALGLSVGVPVPKDTDTTATTATTTTPDSNAPTSTKKEAGEAIVASGVAIKGLGKTMSNGGKTSDKVFAKQLDKDGTAIAEAQIRVAGLKAPTAADQKLVDQLAAVLKQTYSDVARLSLAAEHGDTTEGKAATKALVTDAGEYKSAVDALTKSLTDPGA